MGERRGRRSEAELTNVVVAFRAVPLEPPEGFTESQREIWQRVTRQKAPDFFNGCIELLTQYVRVLDVCEKIAEDVNGQGLAQAIEKDGVRAMRTILSMMDQQTRLAATLATRLRITNQARFRPTAAAVRHLELSRPWQHVPNEGASK